jgi:hypothetical protein
VKREGKSSHWNLSGPCLGLLLSLGLSACSLVTVPVETAVKVTGTVVSTTAKMLTAPIRWAADAMTSEPEDKEKQRDDEE